MYLSRRRKLMFAAPFALAAGLATVAGLRTINHFRAESEPKPAVIVDVTKIVDPKRTPEPQETDAELQRPSDAEFDTYLTVNNEYCIEEYGLERAPQCNVKGFQGPEVNITPEGFPAPFGKTYSEIPPRNTLRVLAIGGSTTGTLVIKDGYTFSWPGRLQKNLEDYLEENGVPVGNDGITVEVINAGVPGFNSYMNDEFFEKYLHRFHPDMLVLGEEVNDVNSCYFAREADQGKAFYTVLDYFNDDATLEDVAEINEWHQRHRAAFEDAKTRYKRGKLIRSARGFLAGEESFTTQERIRSSGAIDEPSPLDDATWILDYTLGHYDNIIRNARRAGVKSIAIAGTPQDFDDWENPRIGIEQCPHIFGEASHHWYRYIQKVQNPGLREYAGQQGAGYIDLERAFTDAIEGVNSAEANLVRLFGAPYEEAVRRYEELSSTMDLFGREWMHPNELGYGIVAAETSRMIRDDALSIAKAILERED